jgi:hypothetical protein
VITEMMVDSKFVGDDYGEWVEIYNNGSAPVDLAGWTIKDANASHLIQPSGAKLVVAPKSYMVLGINSNPGTNGNVAVAYQYSSNIKMGNDHADKIELRDPGSNLIDVVLYTPSWPWAKGYAMELKGVNLDNSLLSSWCTATTSWSGSSDYGSPGSANTCP